MKSLGPGRALEEPMSGDVGDGLRYLVYHGFPHDSGPFFGFQKVGYHYHSFASHCSSLRPGSWHMSLSSIDP